MEDNTEWPDPVGPSHPDPIASKPPPPTEQVPDPEEDDLDDLDDILDDFSATKVSTEKPPEPAKPTVAADGKKADTVPAAGADVDFAEQLQAGMADLLGELDKSPEMQRQFEDLVKEMGGATASATPPGLKDGLPQTTDSSTGPAFPPGTEESFQETIRKTMQRMQESGQQATAAATSEGADDVLAEMMKQMQGDALGEGPAGSEEDFSKILLGMMEQLTNKDILYEPMKELHEKYPGWMQANRAKTPAGDLQRYEEQQTLVAEIVGKFEEKDYSDSKAEDREFIVERMQKMQAAGSPPADLVGDLNAAQEALGDLDSGCPQQ